MLTEFGKVDRGLKTRLVWACLGLVMLLSVLSLRLIYIEACHGERLSSAARARYEYKEEIPAPRGRIYDRDGELLARNQTVYELVVDCQHIRDQGLACIGLGAKENVSPQTIRKKYLPDEILSMYRQYVVDSLATPLRKPQQDLAQKLRSRETGVIVLSRDIEDDFAEQLEAVLEEKKLRCIFLRRGERRYYPSPLTLTQVIGFVDNKGEGKSGIEKTMNDVMTGKPGYRYCERDSRRREIHAYRGLTVDPVAGEDVYLTIDMELQSVVEREMDAVIDRYRPEKVTAIWLEPHTNKVLAMSSRPHFDLSTRGGIRDTDPVRRNIAITDNYEPGSTFKIVGYGGAFDRGLANPSTEVDCHMGIYEEEGFPLRDHHPYGMLTARMSFAKSSNVGAYLIARPLNRRGFHSYIEKFGFGQKTGIELSAESPGRIFSPEKWSLTSFSSQVKGYEVSATPLQLAVACSVIVNGGRLVPPTIIEGTKNPEREQILSKEASASVRRVISEKAANQLRQCMIQAAQPGGTGTKAVFPGYSLAGKTGTARKCVEGEGYVPGRYVASFMGFFPAEDPKLIGLIVVDDPKAKGSEVYGGSVAAPVFKAIAEEAAKIFEIEPDRPEELLPESDLVQLSGEDSEQEVQ